VDPIATEALMLQSGCLTIGGRLTMGDASYFRLRYLVRIVTSQSDLTCLTSRVDQKNAPHLAQAGWGASRLQLID